MTDMTDNHPEEVATGEATPVIPPTTVTRTYYERLAAEITEDLDRIVAKFPKLEVAHRVPPNHMRAHVNVPIPFLDAAIFVTEDTPRMDKAAGLVPAEGRDTLQYLDAFRRVDQKLVAVRAELRFTMMSRRARLAIQSLNVYDLAQSYARDRSVPGIGAHLETLRRTLGKRGRPRKKRASDNPPEPPESATE